MEAQKAEWAKQFKDQVEISMYNKEQDGEDMFGDSRVRTARGPPTDPGDIAPSRISCAFGISPL